MLERKEVIAMGDFKFDAAHREFSLVNALGCARASLLAYDDPEVGRVTVEGWGFKNFEPYTRNHHFGIAFGNAELVLVAFRGTNEKADWLTNLNVFLKRSPLGWVHRGFMKATELFWPDLPQKILEFRDQGQAVWITGHSLGGALAVLAAAKMLNEHKLRVAGICTFGQPSVGGLSFCRKFKEQFAGRLFRFVNHTDAVSDVPIFFQEHVGEVRYFDTSGALWLGDPPWRVSFLDHWRAPRKFGGLAQFSAHSMRIYVGLLTHHVSEGQAL